MKDVMIAVAVAVAVVVDEVAEVSEKTGMSRWEHDSSTGRLGPVVPY